MSAKNSALQCAPPESPPWFSSLRDVTRVGARFTENAQDPEATEKVQQYRTFRMHCLTTTLSIVDAATLPRHALVSVRLKRLDSIVRKMRRTKFDFKLGDLYDIVGVRVILPTLQDTLAMSGRVEELAQRHRTNDYITKPQPTGYRSVHHIMRFRQALSAEQSLKVRFELQVRSFYQHRWAIWSEAQGEAVKAGSGSEDEHSELIALSERIARWEKDNPEEKQAELPEYVDSKNIAVVWRQPNAVPMFFNDDMHEAVEYLNYMETHYPADRGNALLLVGVSNPEEVEMVLRQTHPLYMMSRIIEPEYWMPDS